MVHQIDITQRGGKFNEGSHNSKKQNGYISKTSIPGCALTMLLFQLKRIRSCQGRFNYVVYYFYAKYLGRLDDAKQRKSGMT